MAMSWMRDPIITKTSNIQNGLHDLCKYISSILGQLNIMYEIGSYAGESADIFAQYFKSVHCVDPWEEGDPRKGAPSLIEEIRSFNEIMAKNFEIIHKHKCYSIAIAPNVANWSLDFVYIDADHSYTSCFVDISTWWPKIKKGAFIGGHDYWPDQGPKQGVMSAIRDFFATIKGEDFRTYSDQSWSMRKPIE